MSRSIAQELLAFEDIHLLISVFSRDINHNGIIMTGDLLNFSAWIDDQGNAFDIVLFVHIEGGVKVSIVDIRHLVTLAVEKVTIDVGFLEMRLEDRVWPI
jgi:hypothetical protein